MDIRSSAIWLGVVAAFFLLMVFPSVGFSGLVHIYGGTFDLPLLDPTGPGSAMTEAAIEVSDHFVIEDLDVRINITHTNVFDLQLFLQSPTGTKICLNMFDFKEFSVYPNYTNTIFDDEAMLSIKDGEAPFTGRFRPLDKLSNFDGQDTYGSWHLQIYDMWPTDTGTLNSFELMVSVPEPATAILFTLAVALLRLCKPRLNH
jgi:subtilisin-like proprotein convertase family protein